MITKQCVGLFKKGIKNNKINKVEQKKHSQCSVCYLEYQQEQKICKNCKVCYSCLDNWFAEQLKGQQNDPYQKIDSVKITCPGCRLDIPFSEIEKDQHNFRKTLDNITEIQIRKDGSFIGCPSGSCKNVGWVNNIDCQEGLSCTACNYTWQNKQSIAQKVIIQFSFAEFMTQIFKWIFTKACPNCNAPIQKMGGCKNMTCSNCKKSFCWLCKYSTHYQFSFFCTIKLILKSLIFFTPIHCFLFSLGIYDNLIFIIPKLFSIQYVIFDYGLIFILAYFFRVIYQFGFFAIIFSLFFFPKKLIFFSLLLVDLICWYYFTKWIELLYYFIIIAQVGLSTLIMYF